MFPRDLPLHARRKLRLGLLLGANLLALAFLLYLLNDRAGPLGAKDSSLPQREAVSLETIGAGLLALESQRGLAQAAPVELEPLALVPELGPGDAALERRIESHIRSALKQAGKASGGRASAANCTVAISVLGPGGEALIARHSEVALRPASNMKLVTSSAALVALGDDWHFETRFESSAEILDGVLMGDLVVHAGGDPFFDPAGSGRVAHLLAPVALALGKLGVREIRGDLVLDEGTYLVPGPVPGWPAADQYWQEHCALAAGLTANASCLTAVVVPRSVGAEALAELRPQLAGLKRSGKVMTVSAKTRLNIAVGASTRKATLRGVIPVNAKPWEQRFSHPDPVALFGAVLEDVLASAGIQVGGRLRRERGLAPGRILCRLRTPIGAVLGPINAESNNAVADQLFYALGDAKSGAGTGAGAQAAVRAALRELGVSAEGLVQIDGSGLSRDNRVSTRQLSALLRAVQLGDERTASLLRHSLAVAGRTGSLATRMRGSPAEGLVFAKTGWIRGTSALSGYVQIATGEFLCFSILVEYPDVGGLNKQCWKPMGDAICADLVTWVPRNGGQR